MTLTQTASDIVMLPFQIAFFFMAAPLKVARWGVKTGRQGASYLLDSFPDTKMYLLSQKSLGAVKVEREQKNGSSQKETEVITQTQPKPLEDEQKSKSSEEATRTLYVEFQDSPYSDVLETLRGEMESAENERERAEAKRISSLRQMLDLSEENRSRISKEIIFEKTQAEYLKEEYYKLHSTYAETAFRLKQAEDEAVALAQLNAYQTQNLQSAMEDLERATNLIKTLTKNEDILKSQVEQDFEKLAQLEEAVNRGVLAELQLSQAVAEEQEQVRQLMAELEEKRIKSANVDFELRMSRAKNADLKKALDGDRYLLQRLDSQLAQERSRNADMRRRFQIANLELVDLAVREEQRIRQLEDSNGELAQTVLHEAQLIDELQEQLEEQPVLIVQKKITVQVPVEVPVPYPALDTQVDTSSQERDLQAEAVQEEPEFDLEKKSFKEALLEHTEQEALIKNKDQEVSYGATDASTPNPLSEMTASY